MVFLINTVKVENIGWVLGVTICSTMPMDRNQNIIPEELAKLGHPASHGCIRLLTEDAEWLYNNINDGTPVLIRP